MTDSQPDQTAMVIDEAQPLSFALGANLADVADALKKRNETPGAWRSEGHALTAHIDALMSFAFQSVNVIRALEAEVMALKQRNED